MLQTPQDSSPSPPADAPPPDASAIEDLVGGKEIRAQVEALLQWAHDHLLTVNVAIEWLILIAALVPAALFGPHIKKFITNHIAPHAPYGIIRRAAHAFAIIATPIALLIILQVAVITLHAFGQPSKFVEAGVSVLSAWIVVRLFSLVIRSPFWSRVVFWIVWPVAALNAFGLLGRVIRELQAFSFPIGADAQGKPIPFSALDLLRTVVIFAALFWIANLFKRFLKGRISAIEELTASFKALLSKILDVLLPIIALLIALQLVHFPFGTLAVFGGAVGLGVGLGLQKTVSNFFAGFTLIADKSIKPGDVVQIGDTFGWITEMNARYVSIRTRDGMEHLMPNDKFIEEGVVNWSHSDRVIRLHASFSVSYNTRDLRGVKKLAEETALTVERVLKSPAPMCNLMEFADSSVNFDLRFWINDPANGVSNVRSAVLLAIWDALHDHNIEIPFPQLDLHVKSLPAGPSPLAGPD